MATQASVAATLQKKGFAMTLGRVVPGTYDPVTGFSGGSSASYAVHGIIGNFNSTDRAQSWTEDGTAIRVGDKKALIEAGVVVPIPGDTLTINGVSWRVIMVDTVNPQGIDLIYKLQVRK